MNNVRLVRSVWHWDRDLPLSQVAQAGDFLWLSGQTPFNEDGEIVGRDDLQEQARQVFSNMRHVLELFDCDLTSVVRLTNFFVGTLSDEQRERYWEVRREFFGDHLPASTGVYVSGLIVPEMMMEVDAIAYAPGARLQNQS